MARIGSLQLRETEVGKGRGISLLNSASPWASNESDLRALYESPFTAAVTTRTAVVTSKDIAGLQTLSTQDDASAFQSTFAEDKRVHAHSFLRDTLKTIEGGRLTVARGSLNSYGYSPHPLSSYLRWAADLLKSDPLERKKPFILSLTGTADVLEATIVLVRKWAAIVTGADVNPSPVIAIEVNLSCPNIKGNEAPSGYDAPSISAYVLAAQRGNQADAGSSPQLSIGLKLPPYTYTAQYHSLIQALCSAPPASPPHAHPIAFLTSTNTLGSCFWLNEGEQPNNLVRALPGIPSDEYDGTGGLAGESLHPISLGNVYRISNMLQSSEDSRLHSISIVGVGGVMSGLSAQRMRSAGAQAVALATALGREGTDVFQRISNEALDEAL